MNTYQRETKEFIQVDVYRDGVLSTEGVTFDVVRDGERGSGFVAATVLNGKTGVVIDNLTPGTYRIWARVIDILEAPVIDCGLFRVV